MSRCLIDVTLSKIVCTLGPATSQPEAIVKLIEEGARVFRINFSHGGFDDFARLLEAVREAGRRSGMHVGVLGDLSGPKIRIGKVRGNGVELRPGDRIELQRPVIEASDDRHDDMPWRASVTWPGMIDEVEPGHRVLIDDGQTRTLAIERTGEGDDAVLVCRVTAAGRVSSGKGINLPDTELSVPSLTDWDRQCAAWAVENELDYLALSFVRKADDLRELKALLQEHVRDGDVPIPIVAKIEKPQAIDDLEAIIEESSAVMVARGDLGVEMDPAEVPAIQKRIIGLAHGLGRPVIVATQMLQSMIDAPVPTRAEASDVANAIYDGADAVMLSGETAVGRYPVPAVVMMSRIVRLTEKDLRENGGFGRPGRAMRENPYRTAALARGVSTVVQDLRAKLVVTWSERGGSARYLSQNRLPIPIIAASTRPWVLRRLSLHFGVVPVLQDRPRSSVHFVRSIDRLLVEQQCAQRGDPVVIVKGEPIGTPGVTNEMLIHYVGDTVTSDRRG